METIMNDRSARMRKIRGLLDKASNKGCTPAEADAFRAKAEELMTLHMISEFELANVSGKQRPKPLLKRIAVFGDTKDLDQETATSMAQMLYSIISSGRSRVGRFGGGYIEAFGYEDDLDFAEQLYVVCQMELVRNMFPRYDPDLVDGANVHVMKRAGYEWIQIHRKFIEAGRMPAEPFTKPIGLRLYNQMRKWLEITNEEQIKSNPSLWRTSYIEGFTNEITRRLYSMKAAREGVTDSGGALVLMRDDLDAGFYELFPERRPHAADCDCERCHRCGKLGCQREACVNARRPVRYLSYKEPSVDRAAKNAGARAASQADLSGGRNNIANPKGAIS